MRNNMRSLTYVLIFSAMAASSRAFVIGFTPFADLRPRKLASRDGEDGSKKVLLNGDSVPPVGSSNKNRLLLERMLNILSSTTMALLLTTSPAYSADFAGTTISGQDFSNQDLRGRDFKTVIAQGTNFRNANLEGADFQSAKLEKADFSGANLQNAKFDDAVLDGTIMKDVTAQRASFSKTILDVGDLENADLTQSLWPSKYRVMICDMSEIKGTNPVTGVDSRGSVMCNSELKYSN